MFAVGKLADLARDALSGGVLKLFHGLRHALETLLTGKMPEQPRTRLVGGHHGFEVRDVVVRAARRIASAAEKCAQVRLSSELAFKQEVAWATHLSVPAVLLPAPGLSCANYARQINQLALSATYLQLWVSVPTSAPCVDESSDSTAAGTVDDDPWSHWNRLRALCDGHPSLGVSLELTADLPPRTAMDRWFGEPVKAVVLPTSIFLTNAKGYPTLSTRHQHAAETTG